MLEKFLHFHNVVLSLTSSFQTFREINLQYKSLVKKVTLTKFLRKNRGGKFFKLPHCDFHTNQKFNLPLYQQNIFLHWPSRICSSIWKNWAKLQSWTYFLFQIIQEETPKNSPSRNPQSYRLGPFPNSFFRQFGIHGRKILRRQLIARFPFRLRKELVGLHTEYLKLRQIEKLIKKGEL